MGIMQELVLFQGSLVNDIETLFPRGIMLGVGVSEFVDDGPDSEMEPPIVTTKALDIESDEWDSYILFNRISYIAMHTTRERCDYDSNQHPAMTFVVGDEHDRDCGIVVVSVAANRFRAKDYGIDADEFVDKLREYIKVYANVNRTYGGIFF